MKRSVLLLVLSASVLGLAACGGGEVDVVAQIVREGEQADSVPLQDLPIYLLPYDRDVIFDSLAQAYGTPEPQIPDTLLALQESIAEAQQAWQTAETRWQVARDSLQALSRQLQRTNRASAQYRVMFNEFQDLEQVEANMRRAMDTAFQRFTQLQSRLAASSQEIRAQRQAWGDAAFQEVDAVIEARIEALGLEEQADTTSAAGVAQFRPKPGQWWIHARYELPYSELYWNVPIEVARGEPLTIRLTRENAQERPKL